MSESPAVVLQRTTGCPEKCAPGYHVILDAGPVVTVRVVLLGLMSSGDTGHLLRLQGQERQQFLDIGHAL